MTYGPHPIPPHAPLKPCPFCGREGKVEAHRWSRDQPVRYQVGCWIEDDPLLHRPPWDDCFGPLSDESEDLDELVRRWNRRDRGTG